MRVPGSAESDLRASVPAGLCHTSGVRVLPRFGGRSPETVAAEDGVSMRVRGQVEKPVPVERIVYKEVPVPVDKVTIAGQRVPALCAAIVRVWASRAVQPCAGCCVPGAVMG